MIRRWLRRGFIAGASIIASASLVAAQDRTTVTVVPFAAQSDGAEIWLGKAIADILSRKFSAMPGVVVLDRERLQTFLREMEFQESGFVDRDAAAQIGRVARVDQVVYGTFDLTGTRLSVSALRVNLEDQTVQQSADATGAIDELYELANRIALDLVAERAGTLSDNDLALVQFAPTTSLPATEHFYTALDHIDRGRYEDAFGSFYAATRRDPDYREAHLWMARTLEFLQRGDLATASFDALERLPGRHVEKLDAIMFKAMLLEQSDPTRAAALYKDLLEREPRSAHALNAAYRLADMREAQGDYAGAYRALAVIDARRSEQELLRGQGPARARLTSAAETDHQDANQLLPSRFFTLGQGLDLYREAIVRMVALYDSLLTDPNAVDELAPPRGTFFIDPDHPIIEQDALASEPALFFEQQYTGNWREIYYAVVAPPGYVITGAEIGATGSIRSAARNHSFGFHLLPFPLPADHNTAWLGTLYGQTAADTSLTKRVNFFGEHHRLLTVRLVESSADISRWHLRVNLAPDEPGASEQFTPHDGQSEAFYEGREIASISLGAERITTPLPQFLHQQQPRRTIALVDRGVGLYLVAARGEIGGRPTDLWASSGSSDGPWTAPVLLPINAAGDDIAPQLVAAEDGSTRLFWLSNRRGRGWEVWTSTLPPNDTADWSSPRRVPIAEFSASASGNDSTPQQELLPFAVMQDQAGRWALSFFAPGERQITVLTSTDAERWTVAGAARLRSRVVSLASTQDTGGKHRIIALTGQGESFLFSSNDLEEWSRQRLDLSQPVATNYAVNYPLQLIGGAAQDLVLLHSDSVFGLQYAPLHGDSGASASPDLVANAGFQGFAAATQPNGRHVVALQDGDRIELREYQGWRAHGADDHGRSPLIYTEADQDASGNHWRRTFARRRIIVPDVAAVAVERDGRIWWSVETAIFSLKDDIPFFQDVTEGFIYHHVSMIEPCGRQVYFASDQMPEARIGVASARGTENNPNYAVSAIPVPTASGRVTEITCYGNNRLLVGTRDGDLVVLEGERRVIGGRLPDGEQVTAATGTAGVDVAFIGTNKGSLFRLIDERLEETASPVDDGRGVRALAVDAQDRLWAAFDGYGLFVRTDGAWKDVTAQFPSLAGLPIAALDSDGSSGVWLLAGPETLSPGLIHIDGTQIDVFNPPHRRLVDPVDLTVADDGSVWIGTAFNGLYQMQPASP